MMHGKLAHTRKWHMFFPLGVASFQSPIKKVGAATLFMQSAGLLLTAMDTRTFLTSSFAGNVREQRLGGKKKRRTAGAEVRPEPDALPASDAEERPKPRWWNRQIIGDASYWCEEEDYGYEEYDERVAEGLGVSEPELRWLWKKRGNASFALGTVSSPVLLLSQCTVFIWSLFCTRFCSGQKSAFKLVSNNEKLIVSLRVSLVRRFQRQTCNTTSSPCSRRSPVH